MAAAPATVRLLDHTGTPIPVPGPAAPSLRIDDQPPGTNSDARDRYREYPSRRLSVSKIVDILELADQGDPYELIQLCEEMVEKDGKIEAVLLARSNSIAGLNWDTAPPRLSEDDAEATDLADEIAKFCRQALDTANFRELVGDLMDSVCKPFAVDWITWAKNRAGQIVPRQFSRIPTSHIRWAFDTDELRVYDPARPTATTGGYGTPLEPYTTIRAINLDRRDHPTRAGLGRTLIWPYFFKTTQVKDMLSYGDRYGMPIRLLKVDAQDFESPERYRKFRSAMRDLGSEGSGIISKNADLVIQDSGGGRGVEIFISNVNYFDKWIAWKVLGHELSSQSSPGQGQLGITAALEVRQDIKEADCERISASVKRDVLVPMVGWNFGWDKVEAGLVPNLQFDYELPRDLVAQSTVLDRVLRLFPALTVSKSKIRDDYGIPAPIGGELEGPEDDALESVVANVPAAPSAAPAGGLDPMGMPNDAPGGGPAEVPDGQDPEEAPEDQPTPPRKKQPVMRSRLAADVPKPMSPEERQKPVDELASRGIKAGEKTASEWAAKVRAVLRDAADRGLTYAETRRRIIEAYPQLPAGDLETTLRQQMLLTRLWGRNAR